MNGKLVDELFEKEYIKDLDAPNAAKFHALIGHCYETTDPRRCVLNEG